MFQVSEAPVQVKVTEAQSNDDNFDLPSRKQRLQHEATIALAQVTSASCPVLYSLFFFDKSSALLLFFLLIFFV